MVVAYCTKTSWQWLQADMALESINPFLYHISSLDYIILVGKTFSEGSVAIPIQAAWLIILSIGHFFFWRIKEV